MNRDEMLKQLGLTDHEMKDLLEKYRVFKHSLNQGQQEALHRSLPRLEEAVKSFGAEASKEDLHELCCIPAPVVTCFYFLATKGEK